MGFEVVAVPDLPAPGQFTHVAKKGKFVFISGQTATSDADAGNLDPGAQAERIFGYLKLAVEAAGGDMSDIVKINIFLTRRGQALRAELMPLAKEVVGNAVANFSEEEKSALLNYLKAVQENLSERMEADMMTAK